VPHAKKPIQNVNDTHLHRLYWANLGFFAERIDDDGENLGRTYFSLSEPVEVIDIASNNWFDAIIGMDILQHYQLRFEGRDFYLRLA
jgi:hypothetical protein